MNVPERRISGLCRDKHVCKYITLCATTEAGDMAVVKGYSQGKDGEYSPRLMMQWCLQ